MRRLARPDFLAATCPAYAQGLGGAASYELTSAYGVAEEPVRARVQ